MVENEKSDKALTLALGQITGRIHKQRIIILQAAHGDKAKSANSYALDRRA